MSRSSTDFIKHLSFQKRGERLLRFNTFAGNTNKNSKDKMALAVSRTDDSAIDMELSQLSNIQEEDDHEPHERETLMGKERLELHIDLDIPVPPELEMPRTPRMPLKTFADIKDPPAPSSTSTPAPGHHHRRPSVTFREISDRTDPEDLQQENNCNNADDDEQNQSKDLSEESDDKCEDCKPIEPKTRGQFSLLLACIGLSVLVGFLIGYFIREEKYKQEHDLGLVDDGVCGLKVPSSLTKQQLNFHEEIVRNVSKLHLEEFSSMMAQSQCMSGTPCSSNLSNQLMKKLKKMGLPKVEGTSYNVLVSTPVLTIPSTLKTMDGEGNVMETIILYGSSTNEETNTSGKTTSGAENSPDGINKRSASGNTQMPPITSFVPYSANGTVQGDLLYVKCADTSDFTVIAGMGINATGRIGIARMCRNISTMEQAKNAAKIGLVGLLLYTDPADVKDSMTSGMDASMLGMFGDPMTPGCASKDGMPKDSKMIDMLPVIPVQTIATNVAMALLGNITGKEAPGDWQGGFNLTYHVGRQSTKPLWTVELDVHNTMQQQDIHNIMVTIPGTTYPDQYVMMGGHYTDGMMSSTSDPMSSSTATGSTSMVMEVASGLADLLEEGWQPKRTVMLSLWEGTEMGNMGSMEWVQEHQMVLADRAVAYIDMDTTMAAGTMVTVETSPVLNGVVMDATEQLELQDVVMLTGLDEMGDHVPFSHMLGVPSVSIHTTVDMDSSPVENIDVSTTQLATKTLLLLADNPVIQYDGLSLVDMVDGYVSHLATMMTGAMNDTMKNMKMTTTQYMQTVTTLQSMIDDLDDTADPVKIGMINERLMYMEKAFVMNGVSGTERHVLYGSKQMETFPIMVDAMSEEEPDMDKMEGMISMVQCMLQSATMLLSIS